MATVDKILEISREIFDDNELSASTRIMEARGFDSLRHVQFVIEVEDHLKINIDAEKISPSATISEIASVVDSIRS